MKEEIKYFARNILGCGCEEEVFARIETERDLVLPGGIHLSARIDIGGRLLIYIVNSEVSTPDIETVKRIVMSGIEDRNVHSFNRFRLAIAGPEDGAITAAFKAFAEKDEKVHLHFLEKKDMPDLDS